MSFVYTFGGNVIQAANQGYNNIVYSANTQLSWPTQFLDTTNVTAAVLYLSPTAGGFTVTLPDATLASIGQVILVVNHTAFNTSLSTFLAGSTFPVNSGTAQIFILRNNTTQDGQWDNLPAGGGVVAVTSVAAVTAGGVTSSNLTIAGSPITSAGTFTFTLAGDLLGIANIAALPTNTGIVVRTAANTWNVTAITGTANQITVINGSGVAGAPTISLPTIITGINNLTVADLNFSSNIITTTVANQNLILQPNGNGRVTVDNTNHVNGGLFVTNGMSLGLYGTNNTNILQLQAGNITNDLILTLPTTLPVVGQAPVVAATGAGTATLTWQTIATSGGVTTVNALARYLNTTGSLNNSTVLLDNAGNLSNINSAVISNIQLATVGAGIISTSVGPLTISPNGVSPTTVTSTLNVTNGNPLALYEPLAGGNNFTSFSCPDIGVNIPYILPNVPPTVSQIEYCTSTAGGNYTRNWGYPPVNQNLLYNGSMLVWQRNTSFTNATFQYQNANDSYTADRWNLQSNGNNIVNVTRNGVAFTNPIASFTFALRSTVVTANTKFGYAQVLNQLDTGMIFGRTVTFQTWCASNGVANLRAALVAWTGFPDVPLLTTGNFINAWNAQGVDPTLSANWAYVVPSIALNTAAPFTQTVSPAITVNTVGLRNLGIFIWCDSTTAAANATWDLSGVKMEFGNVATPYYSPNFSTELHNCMAYFQKDLPYQTSVGTLSQTGTFISTNGVSIGNGTTFATVQYHAPLYPNTNAIPTVFTYGFNPVTQNAGYIDTNVNTAAGTFTPDSISNAFFNVFNNSGTMGPFNAAGCHWYVDCDF